MSRRNFAPSLAAFAVVLSALTGCGGKSSPDNGGNTGGSSNGGGGNGGGAGTAVCERYDDESPISVNVEIINKTSKDIFLGQRMVSCDREPLFSVEDASGKPLPSFGMCRQSCEILRRQGAVGCPAICLFPSAVRLAPGETLHTTWDSLYLVDGSLPKTCLPYDAGQPTVPCDQAKRIEPGTFVFKAIAGHALDCSQTSPSNACAACSVDSSGGCTTPGALIGGDIIDTQAQVLLDERYGYYEAAAPSSGSNSSGDAAPGALNQATVTLVFTE